MSTEINIIHEMNAKTRFDVQDWEYEQEKDMEKGDTVLVHFPALTKLYVCCPGCGTGSFTGTHKITKKSDGWHAEPSIRFSCCGWHGSLKGNYFNGG